jgi:flagellar biosynthesis/type III secretory pathway protein FliH
MGHILKAGTARLQPVRPSPASSQPSPAVERTAPAAPIQPAHAPASPPAIASAALPASAQRDELEALRQQARREGFEAGRQEAQQQFEAAIRRQEAALREAIDAMQADAQDKLRELEGFAVTVAYEACARVLGDAVLDDRSVSAVVHRLLEQCRESGLLQVQLPPAHVDLVRRGLAADPHWQHRAIQVEADPSLAAGECRIVSAHGQLETSLAVQLDAIRETLLSTFAERAIARAPQA